jgi:hypothetical protein
MLTQTAPGALQSLSPLLSSRGQLIDGLNLLKLQLQLLA